jgi:uncharacterized membrane protein YjjP (DUF1212 family)
VSTSADRSPAAHQPDAVAFILRLGRALHAYGYAAHQLEDVLRHASERLGLRAQFFATPTSIFASFGPQDDQRTHLMRVDPGDVDLGKLTRLDEVTRKVLDGEISSDEGSARVEEIARAPGAYPPVAVVLAFALSSGAACRILGGGTREIVTSTVIGFLTGLLALLAGRVPGLRRVFEPTAAMLASAVATIVAVQFPPLSMYVATLGGLIVLLPGLTFTLALTELTTQNLLSGTARMSGAGVIFLTVGLGVALGRQIAQVALGASVIPNTAPTALPLWTEWVALVIAPLAFAVLLKARTADAGWVLAVSLLGFAGGRAGSMLLGGQLGVFVGSLTVGIASNLYARFAQRPAPVTQVPGILLLLPGSIGFQSLASMLDQRVVLGVEAAFTMLLTAVALVTGLLAANVLAPPERWKHPGERPVGPRRGVDQTSREYRQPVGTQTPSDRR